MPLVIPLTSGSVEGSGQPLKKYHLVGIGALLDVVNGYYLGVSVSDQFWMCL